MTAHMTAEEAHKACVACLKGIPGYVARFKAVFGTDDFNIDHVAKAIATFERTVLSGNSPFDKYKAGDKNAMNEEQVRGMGVFFNKAACDSCHIGFNFTDGFKTFKRCRRGVWQQAYFSFQSGGQERPPPLDRL